MTIPTGSYETLMDGFFGYLPDPEKEKLWLDFTSANGLSTAPPETDDTKAKFVSFLGQTYQSVLTLELSPKEVEQRQVLFNVFDVLILLIKTIQNTNVEEQELLVIMGKYQKEYTSMMTGVPVLKGESLLSGIHIDPTNLSQFTLGYNDISIEDIMKYNVETGNAFSVNGQTPTTINFANPIFNTINDNSAAGIQTGTLVLSFVTDASPPQSEAALRLQVGPISYLLSIADASYLPTDSSETKVSKFEESFKTMLGQSAIQALFFSPFVSNPTNFPSIPVPPYTAESVGENPETDAEIDANTQASQRATINQKNQQYIENARAKRDALTDRSNEIRNNIQSAASAIKGQSGVLKSIIQQLKTITDSILSR